MYDWVAKIGMIVPASNTVSEFEFCRMIPKGISVHISRVLDLGRAVSRSSELMEEKMKVASEILAMANVDIIVYCCTVGSLIKGAGYDLEIVRNIEKWTGLPALTTSTAVIQAFKKLKFDSVAVGTPYTEDMNIRERDFFASNGFTVKSIKGLGIINLQEIANKSPLVAYDLAREVDRPDASGVFLSCTNLRTIEIIDMLEATLKKPVVSSNQASLWAALRKIGVKTPIRRFGKLLLEP